MGKEKNIGKSSDPRKVKEKLEKEKIWIWIWTLSNQILLSSE